MPYTTPKSPFYYVRLYNLVWTQVACPKTFKALANVEFGGKGEEAPSDGNTDALVVVRPALSTPPPNPWFINPRSQSLNPHPGVGCVVQGP